jgi:hypothetical protein
VYVGNDPINFNDPSGNVRICVGWSDDPICWDEPDPHGGGGGRGVPPSGFAMLKAHKKDREEAENEAQKAVLTAGYFSALAALLNNACTALFNTTGSGKYHPRDVLASMIFGGTTGSMPPDAYFGTLLSKLAFSWRDPPNV